MPFALLLALLALAPTVPLSAFEITPVHCALAAQYSRSHGGLVLYVRQNGRVVYENNAPGFSESTPRKIYSGTKTFVAVAAMFAIRDGLLTLNERAAETLPEWSKDRRHTITIDELLSQTSGLDPDGDLIYSARDQFKAAIEVPLIDPPGTKFHYGAAGYQAFGEILKRKLQPSGRTVEGYIKDRLLDPLDIDLESWKHDEAGNPLVHAGMEMSAEEWAKLGDLIITEKNEKQKQTAMGQLIANLFTPHDSNPAYGLGFWLNRPQSVPHPQKLVDLLPAMDGDQIYSGGPKDIYTAMGTGKQRLYIIPSLKLVVVRFAYEAPYSDGDFLSRLLTGHPNPDHHTH
jgi:CubicO group peptidase (beta-lactamase class C family)